MERIGIKFQPTSESEVKLKCPVHADESPSVCLNTEKNLWICQASSCKAKGDIVTLLAYILQTERKVILADLATRYDIEEVKEINPQNVEKFHRDIWEAGPLLKLLRDRGVTDDMIRKARLGLHGGRITIPIYDLAGRVVNIRRYLPGAPGALKMQNTPGYGTAKIYQIEQIKKYSTIWICGGEIKALVAGYYLNPKSVGVIAVSAGEGAWDSKWSPMFNDKEVFICMDIDLAGKKASKMLASQIRGACKKLRIIDLPLDRDKYPKGDVNDYVGREHAGTDELFKLMDSAEEFKIEGEVSHESQTALEVRLAQSTDSEYIGKKIAFDAIVSAMDTNPFIVPRTIGVTCTRDQPYCHQCPVALIQQDPDSGSVEMVISALAEGILDMINSPKNRLPDSIHESLRIPDCKVVEFKVKDHFTIRDIRLTPQLSIGNEGYHNVVQPAFCVEKSVELNTPYRFTGVVYPHPKTQQAVLIVSEVQEVEDSLSTFSPKGEDLEALAVFQPNSWTYEGIKEQLDNVYEDFETNVTQIFGRRELHLAIDLAYHSVLQVNIDGRQVPGWTQILIIGDTSQGKSDCTQRLQEHYGLGERVDCKSATAAGIIGGLQQLGNRWFVSWGVIPTHDRRLVILEEVKGASTELLSKMTDMRSSGIAEIPKIERRRALARTRLIFISNPRSDRSMSSYNFGIDAIRELMGSPEDIRRCDMTLIVSKTQVDISLINKTSISRAPVNHRFNNELSRRLILWAWTRKQNHVTFEVKAVEACMNLSNELCNVFSESMPLIDRGSARYKLARLAASLAVRTFSIGETSEHVLVRACHVEFIYRMLHNLYSDKCFGYLDFSKAQTQASSMLDPEIVKRKITATKHPYDMVRQLLYRDEITLNDIMDWCEVDKEVAQTFLSFFVRKHALFRIKQWYQKTPTFILLLKEMEMDERLTQKVDEKDEY